MYRYYQLIVFLTVYCIKNNCDPSEPTSQQFLCKSHSCNEPIFEVEATQSYLAPDALNKLKFKIGDKLNILGVTPNREYLLAKSPNGLGLVTSKFVKEMRKMYKGELVSARLDGSWKPIFGSFPVESELTVESSSPVSKEESVTESSSVSADPSDTSSNGVGSPKDSALENSSTGNEDVDLPPPSIVPDSLNDKNPSPGLNDGLETSFLVNSNIDVSTLSPGFHSDPVKTAESENAVKAEEITKSRSEEFSTAEISPSQPSIDSSVVGIASTTEIYGTKFPIDFYLDEEPIDSSSHNIDPLLQASTPKPNMETTTYAPSNEASVIPSTGLDINLSAVSTVSPNLQSEIITQSRSAAESPQILNLVNQNVDSQFGIPSVQRPTQESPVEIKPHVNLNSNLKSRPTTIDTIPVTDSAKNHVDNPTHQHDQPPSSSESLHKATQTGLDDSVNRPSETSPEKSTESISSNVLEQVDAVSNDNSSASNAGVHSSEAIESKLDFQPVNDNQPPPLESQNTHSPPSLIIQKRDLNQQVYTASSAQASPEKESVTELPSLSADLPNAPSDDVNTQRGINEEKPIIGEIDEITLPSMNTNPIPDPLDSLKSFPGPKDYQETGSLTNDNPNLDGSTSTPSYQSNLGNPEASHVPFNDQKHQFQQPVTESTHYHPHEHQRHYNEPSFGEDVLKRQMAPELDKSVPSFPPKTDSIPSVSSDPIQELSLPPSPSSSETFFSPETRQNFEPNLAHSPDESSLPSSSSASQPSDQQSYNASPEPLKDTFPQTFTESPVPEYYIETMRSQVAPFSTALPEPIRDYLQHIHFSPDIFVILLMITFTWITMFISTQVFSAKREKRQLEDQLCVNHKENFNLMAERDYLLNELSAEKEKNSRLLRENKEMEDKYENMNNHVEHSEALVNETRKQKQKIDQLERENETLKNEISTNINKLGKLQEDCDALSKELRVVSTDKEALEDEVRQLEEECEHLKEELDSNKSKETDLLDYKERLEESLKTIESMKSSLDGKEQEIQSMKSFIQEYYNKSNAGSVNYSLDELLDGIKLKADLKTAQSQLISLKEEKISLAAKVATLEMRTTKLEGETNEAVKLREDAERKLSILQNYFSEQEVALKTEVGTWKSKYEDILNKNKSLPEYIEDLKRSNEAFKSQVAGLEREIAKRDEKHRVDCNKLERDKHELYLSKIRVTDDLKKVKAECEILRRKLTLKSQGYRDEDLKQHADGSVNMDSLPPPPPRYLDDSLDPSSGASWSHNAVDSPPPPLSWMNMSDSSISGYSSLPPVPLPLQTSGYPSHHHYPAPMPLRDTYSPSSQRSHDGRSVRSDISFSSTNNSHFTNFGPPPHPTGAPTGPIQGSANPFSNPIPSHWSVNAHQQQPSSSQYHQTDSTTNYHNTGNR